MSKCWWCGLKGFSCSENCQHELWRLDGNVMVQTAQGGLLCKLSGRGQMRGIGHGEEKEVTSRARHTEPRREMQGQGDKRQSQAHQQRERLVHRPKREAPGGKCSGSQVPNGSGSV